MLKEIIIPFHYEQAKFFKAYNLERIKLILDGLEKHFNKKYDKHIYVADDSLVIVPDDSFSNFPIRFGYSIPLENCEWVYSLLVLT